MGSRGIALLFNLGARWGWVVIAKSRPLYPRERPGTHCTGGWVGPRASLEGCGKSRPHRDWIPVPSSQWRVAIPTALSRSTDIDRRIIKVDLQEVIWDIAWIDLA